MVGCAGRGREMPSHFTVKVSHNDKPLAGVSVDVLSGDQKRFSGISSQPGTVRVTNLDPGDYWLIVQYLDISATYQCFHVEAHPSRAATKHLSFDWGDLAPSVREVAGSLIDSQPGKGGTPIWNMTHRVPVPIPGAVLKVINALTGTTFDSVSGNSGQFHFPSIPDGTYVLHVEGGTYPGGRTYNSGDFVIKVNATASPDVFSITNREAGGGNCGGLSLEVRSGANES